jgi:hypothetical protein
MNVAETLDAAADYIEKHGWMPNGARMFPCGAGGPLCAANAIVDVTQEAEITPALDALGRALGGSGCDAIFRWNDAPGRTKEEVVALLRAVACTERAREIKAEVALAHERVIA